MDVMRTLKNLSIAVLALLFLAGDGVAQTGAVKTKRGTTAAPFLEIGVGARAVGLGQAYVALANDAASAYWNPAGLALIGHSEGTFSRNAWIADVNLDYVAVAIDLETAGALAISYNVMNSGDMRVTTEERPEGTGELFHVQDMCIGVSYARKLTDRVAIGGSMKYIHSSLWRLTGGTFAFDGGLRFETPLPGVSLGLSISNFGAKLRMEGTTTAVRYDPDLRVLGNNDGIIADLNTKAWNLPLLFRFGVAYAFVLDDMHTFTVATDVLYPNNDLNSMNVGAEYCFWNRVFFRGGYQGFFLSDHEGGLNLGGGVRLDPVKVDYAYTDMGRLASVHRFSVAVMF
jgi:hypothetical protein